MVEMLAVMFIITMLLVIGTPSALRYRAQSRARATQAIINQIDQAVRMYYDAHTPHEYPEKKSLARRLTGHKDNDNKEGYGYRVQKRGRVYGPWNSTEKLARSGENFADSYGTEIEYYPFNPDTRAYEGAVNNYAKDPNDPTGQTYYRRDFVLRSRGENGEFEQHPHPYGNVIPDDITNFFEE